MPTFDPLEPRTNKSVYAFAASIRDQIDAVLRSDFASGQGFSRFQLWQTPTSTPGAAGLFLGDTTGAQWDVRLNSTGVFNLDRFNSGAWRKTLAIDRVTGNAVIGNSPVSPVARLAVLDPDNTDASQRIQLGYAADDFYYTIGRRTADGLLAVSGVASAGSQYLGLDLSFDNAGLFLTQPGAMSKTLVQQTAGTDLHLTTNARYTTAGGWTRYDGTIPSWAVSLATSVDALIIRRAAAAGTSAITWTNAAAVDGNGVVFLGNSVAAPAANPAGGVYVYAQGGAAKVRGASGTVTTFGPADPHCPQCGADFTTEHFNPRYGYVSVCLFCLAAELGDRPYIVRYVTPEQLAACASRAVEQIEQDHASRLNEGRARVDEGRHR